MKYDILNKYNSKELKQKYNKYNLNMRKIRKLQIGDESKIEPPLFWRNDIINAWCISGNIGSMSDIEYGCENSYWIGIYDTKHYRNRFHCYCTSYGGMCGYKFSSFFRPDDIENKNDLDTQIELLNKINLLIDESILVLSEE